MAGFIQKFIGKWQVAVYMALVFGSAAFLVATLVPPKYRSDFKILIIQNNTRSISAFESVDYLSDVFAEVAYTETFMSDVLASPFEVSRKFSTDPNKRKDEWKSSLKITKIEGTGIIEISVFDTSKKEAEKIAGAVGWNFLENAGKYHGNSANIAVKIIDGPITTSTPAYPNVFLSALLGVLAGFFVSGVLAFFYDSFDLKVAQKQKIGKEMIKNQLEKQMRARNIKKALDYEDERTDFYPVSNLAKKSIEADAPEGESRKQNKSAILHHEELIGRVLAPFEEDQFDEGLKKQEERARVLLEERVDSLEIDKKTKTKQAAEKQEKSLVEKKDNGSEKQGYAPEGNFLTKLYKKSVFADRKFSSQEKAVFEKDKREQKERDAVIEEKTVEQVIKILPPQEEAGKTSSLREKKVSAPENLPIFLDEKDVDDFLKREKGIDKPQQEAAFPQKEVKVEKEVEILNQPKEPKGEGLETEENEPLEELDRSAGGENSENDDIEQEAVQAAPKETPQEKGGEEREPSEEEIKERLNKLLKGEL